MFNQTACRAAQEVYAVKAQARVTIERSVSDVFDYVTDVANMPAWMTGVQAATPVDGTMAAGARYSLQYTAGWRPYELEVTVTEYERPVAFASQVSRGPFAFEGTMTFVARDGGTEITNSIEAGPDSVASRVASLLFGWLLRRSMSRRLLRELETLQHSIEDDTTLNA